MTRFVKVDVLEQLKSEIMSTLYELKFGLSSANTKFDKEIIEKGYEYSKGVEIIERRLAEQMHPV